MHPNYLQDPRAVIAIDAVSISPNVSIYINGTVTGLISIDSLPLSETAEILKSPEDFANFVKKHADDVIKYYFVLYFCPLIWDNMSFPICIIPRTNGNASQPIVEVFDDVIRSLKEIGVKVIGEAYDGDAGWLSRVSNVVEALCDTTMAHPDLSIDKLAFISSRQNSNRMIFEDPMHLVKCDRYRKVSGAAICPSLYEVKPSIQRNDYIECGIQPWIVDNGRYTKMDDALPLKFFTLENIEHLREQERFDLAFSLLPSTLLINAILNENLSREQRIDLLSIGYSIIFIYYMELNEYVKDKKHLQSTSKSGGEGTCVTLYEKNFCKKYLALVAALSSQIARTGKVDLGALGSYHLEHFFGSIRRISHGNDTADCFVNKCYDAILKDLISKILEINTHEIKRVSSSGVRLDENKEVISFRPISYYLQLSWCLYCAFRQPGELFNKSLFKLVTKDGKEIMSEEDAFEVIVKILNFGQEQKIIEVITTKKERMVVSSGLKNDSRNAEASQITKMTTRSETLSALIISAKEKNDSDDEEEDESFQDKIPTQEELIQEIENDED